MCSVCVIGVNLHYGYLNWKSEKKINKCSKFTLTSKKIQSTAHYYSHKSQRSIISHFFRLAHLGCYFFPCYFFLDRSVTFFRYFFLALSVRSPNFQPIQSCLNYRFGPGRVACLFTRGAGKLNTNYSQHFWRLLNLKCQ